MEMFQQESAYDAEMFLEADLTPFRNILDADAAMFTIIKDWRRNNIGGMLTVKVEYVLRSTKTGQTLYTREGEIKVNTSVDGGNGTFGALVGMIATAINTAATDKVVEENVMLLYCLIFLRENIQTCLRRMQRILLVKSL